MGITKFNRHELRGQRVSVNRRHGNTSYKTHWHEYFEMIYYKGCHGTCKINGIEHKITDNSVFLLTPTDFHEINTEYIESSSSIVIGFTEDMIDEKLFSDAIVTPKCLYGAPPFLLQCFETIADIYESDSENKATLHKNLRIRYLINYVMSYVVCLGITTGENNIHFNPTVRKAVSYILNNLSGDVSLTTVAAMCNTTPAYFSTLFHNVMGKTFKSWTNEIKIEHAKRLLEQKEYSIIALAYECGYNNHSHFTKVFKDHTGYSPTQYRIMARSEFKF